MSDRKRNPPVNVTRLRRFSAFDDYREAYKKMTMGRLDQLFEKWQNEFFGKAPVPEEVHIEVEHYTQGGKKHRGALVLLGYELATGEPAGKVIRSSLAYELIHAAFLIHDDVMDRSEIRRHEPTAHRAFEDLGRQLRKDDPKQYGIAMAINAGDIGPAIAYDIVSSEKLPPRHIIQAMNCLNRIIIDTVLGQFLDVTLNIEDKPPEAKILEMQRLKTANYSVTGALRLGAYLGGAGESARGRRLISALSDFGDPVGIAFQIQDDHLGMFATEEVLGKDVSSDLQEKKNTLLFLHVLTKGTPAHRRQLKAALGKPANGAALKRIQGTLTESGAVKYSERKAKALVRRGKKAIPSLTKDQRMASLLDSLADWVIDRGF